jgi:hypothetical protein
MGYYNKVINEFKKKPVDEAQTQYQKQEERAIPDGEQDKKIEEIKVTENQYEKASEELKPDTPAILAITLVTAEETKLISVHKDEDVTKIAAKICTDQKIESEELEAAIAYVIKKNLSINPTPNANPNPYYQGRYPYPGQQYFYMGGKAPM